MGKPQVATLVDTFIVRTAMPQRIPHSPKDFRFNGFAVLIPNAAYPTHITNLCTASFFPDLSDKGELVVAITISSP